jgi:hypothetical protein
VQIRGLQDKEKEWKERNEKRNERIRGKEI